jgi:hypothetical protein
VALFTRSLVEVQRFWYQLGNAAFRLQQQVRLTGGEQLTIWSISKMIVSIVEAVKNTMRD